MAESSENVGRVVIDRFIEIDAPPATVWNLVGKFGDMSWHPVVHSTDNPKGEVVGAVRVLTLGEAGGPTITEELTAKSDEPASYTYRILEVDPSVFPAVNYSSELSVRPAPGSNGSVLEWRCRYDPPPDVPEVTATDAIAGVYDSGLQAAKQALEGETA